MKKKVGIMGGTFDPIHQGHINLAKEAKKLFHLDEVLFIPSGCSYLKNEVSAKEIRYHMVELAIEEVPDFYISDIESKKNGASYTSETLLELKEKNPQTTFYFIVGADTLLYIEHWKTPEIIFSNCILLAAARNESNEKAVLKQINYLQEKYHCTIQLIQGVDEPFSSTEIRQKIKAGEKVTGLNANVLDYIRELRLYQ